MAIAMVQEFATVPGDTSTENYDAVKERLNIDANRPAGLIFHAAGFTGTGVFRIFDVWESEQDWERFNDERLMPAVAPVIESGGAPPSAQYTSGLLASGAASIGVRGASGGRGWRSSR